MLYVLAILFLTNCFSFIGAVTYSDTGNYDAYGIRIASTDDFVVLAANDGHRYVVSLYPFGPNYVCNYNYNTSNDFVTNVAVGRRQNSTQLSFVYLRTNSTDGQYQKLGLFTFSRDNNRNSSPNTCNQMLNMNDGEHEVKVWKRDPSEFSTLQVDLYGKYAYGFLSKGIFIYDIENDLVEDLLWKDVFSSIYIEPHGLDVGETNDGISMAIIAGYYQLDIEKALPAVFLVRLNPPYNMTLVDNYTILSNHQKFVRGSYAFTYQFDYDMSVSIHDSTQQVLISVSQLRKIYLFSFNNTNLTFINSFDHPARSISWLDDNGTQVGLLANDLLTLPWAQSQVQVVNISADNILYAYPNNQQILEKWSNTPPIFIRLTTTYEYQLVILTTDGTVVLVPSADAGYYLATDDINAPLQLAEMCPSGTYKSIRGTTPCIICPTMTKSSSISKNEVFCLKYHFFIYYLKDDSSNSSNSTNTVYPTVNCTVCSTDSFCPLSSVRDVNPSTIQSTSQAYGYPVSSSSPSLDDILMQNTFSLQGTPRRCLFISPFFWALITLAIAFIILLIMGILYFSQTGMKHFQRLECIFRHSDLIGNGELWFGGLVSFAMIVLIIYDFWFGSVFIVKYPIETSTDADFACDTSLTNAQLTSSLELLATIKSDEETPIFNMLDAQQFTMTVNFIQTGFN